MRKMYYSNGTYYLKIYTKKAHNEKKINKQTYNTYLNIGVFLMV